MGIYSRILHHISLEEMKDGQIKKNIKQESFAVSIRKAREFLRNLNSPYYSDWKSSDLKENMTTADVFVTTFPGVGEANLENIDASNASAYTATGGEDALNGTSIKGNGSGSGSNGGFDVGQSYLAFDGDSFSRHAILDPIDSSKFDTMVIRGIVGNDTNGGEDPDAAGEELRLYYLDPNGSSFRSISVNPNGDQVLPANADVIIDLGAGNGSIQNFSISLPSYARGAGFTYMLYQLSNSGQSFDHYGITNIKYQRKGPVSLVVSLDSPEAVSFINDGSGGLTPAEKKKRLEDMLAASDEYLDTQFPLNQEAMRKAEENIKRNIEISLDPDTFKFPEYGTPEYNQMYNQKIDAQSGTEEIDRYLEQQGQTIDTIDKKFLTSLGGERQLLLINNPKYQGRTLATLGIDIGLVKNLTDDSYRQLSKKTYFQPGGTPSTGWDGKFYDYNSPELEKSRIVPLETYMEAKKRDGYYGVERPATAEPGMRYVMEKRYSFSQDDEATPTYTGPRNKQIYDVAKNSYDYFMYGGPKYVGSMSWDYNLYTGSDAHLAGSDYILRELIGSTAKVMSKAVSSASDLAFMYFNTTFGESNSEENIGRDLNVEYDPLWAFRKHKDSTAILELLDGLSSGRDLDSPVEYYTPSNATEAQKSREEYYHKKNNDRLFDEYKKFRAKVDAITSITPFIKDEWYIDNPKTHINSQVTHPYSGLTEPEPTLTPEEPTPEEPTPEEPEKDLTDISKSVSKDVKSDDEIVDELGKVSEYYKDKKIKNPEIQTPNLLKSLVNFFTGADDSLLADVLPAAYEYGADIAASVLTGKPINLTKNNVSTRDLELMFNQLYPSEVDVFSKPEAYADDNIRELPNGNVVVNTTGRNNTRAIYKPPTATLPGGQQVATDFGYSNPIGAAGQAQVQLVVPSSNPRDAYFRYNDHAYYNDQSSDRGELPLGDFDPRRIPGALVNGISRAVYPN